MPNTVRGPSPYALHKPATSAVGIARARHFHGDPTVGRRLERAGGHVRVPATRKPASRFNTLRDAVEHNLLQISAVLFFVGAVGWCWLIFNEFRSSWSAPTSSTYTATTKPDANVGKSDEVGSSAYERIDHPLAVATPYPSLPSTESPASVVAREWNRLERFFEGGRNPAKQIAKAPNAKPPLRVASLERTAPAVAPPRSPLNTGAVTTMVDFATAPFPYHGTMPGSDRPFLNVADNGRLGHTNFRGHILWESSTFSDDRVLLHIPPGFDPRRPAVMLVYFHGHGADLARDVRDRQRLPAQITASGANVVLVAPQFAFDAADSSSGKFWEPNGFKRFLDEAAVKLAKLYGDPRTAFTFARMPIVIVAYSGGFGPTLSVLDRGGVGSRVRGLILLDALYAGIDKFADWIAKNRATFFVSSYTPHTAYHNADLERLLRDRSVPYSSELRRNHLQGMVTFLPTGDISHRDFVTHAWTDNPVTDILNRMDDVDPKVLTAHSGSPLFTASVGATHN